jgi:hypothetical protein
VCLEEASTKAADMVRGFGHSEKVILKVDNEPALTALRDEVRQKLGGAIAISPPAKESE